VHRKKFCSPIYGVHTIACNVCVSAVVPFRSRVLSTWRNVERR